MAFKRSPSLLAAALEAVKTAAAVFAQRGASMIAGSGPSAQPGR